MVCSDASLLIPMEHLELSKIKIDIRIKIQVYLGSMMLVEDAPT